MKYFILGFLLLTGTAHAEWVKIEPLRTVKETGYLGDIFSHTPDKFPIEKGTYHLTDGEITMAHETTHLLHSRLRHKYKKEVFYVLHGKLFIINAPKITLKQIAAVVDKDKRGHLYDLYIIKQQQYWNDNPLYILDELVAYINGCIVGLELKLEKDAVYSYKNTLQMWEYVKVAQELSRQSEFKEQKELDEFLDFVYNNRIKWLEQEYKQVGWLP